MPMRCLLRTGSEKVPGAEDQIILSNAEEATETLACNSAESAKPNM